MQEKLENASISSEIMGGGEMIAPPAPSVTTAL